MTVETEQAEHERALQQEGTSDEEIQAAMADDKIEELATAKFELCDTIKTIYALSGEDPQIAELCNNALEKWEN